MEKKGVLVKLKEKEREKRQTIIIDAARKVFEKKTYDKVSMAEIARVAGMAKSSIYTYFSSQEALYIEVAFRDSNRFIKALQKELGELQSSSLGIMIDCFLDYYILHKAKWRMITHFALHGNPEQRSLEKLNDISRQLMNLFEAVIGKTGYQGDTRLLAHTLFSALSGILISFRNYPGRDEKERIAHMKRIGKEVERMMSALITQQGTL